MEIGQRLQRKLDASDLVQETFLDAHRNFANFEGRTEAQFLAWLRSILAGKAANTIWHYVGTQGRDIRLEQELSASFDLSALRLDQWATASVASPSPTRSRDGTLLPRASASPATLTQLVSELNRVESVQSAELRRQS